jgi:biotin transport system permease protein/energy-coupling factor transport system permease protein
MVMKQAVFRYKTVKGPLHKLPAMVKLFFLLPLSGFCISLSPLWLEAGIVVLILTAFLCGFTLREQITDLKPAAFYALLMYALSVFSILLENWKGITLESFISALVPREDFLRIALSLAVVLQLSALLFRTTSSTEIREGLNAIENFLRRVIFHLPLFGKKISLRPSFAQNITLFLSFIPEIFQTWSNIDLAWKARNGRQGFSRIRTLCFVLITLSFEKAALKSKALAARGN